MIGGMDPNVGLAAERTLLAWIRTGLAMMGFGFVVARFGLYLVELAALQGLPGHSGSGLSIWIGGAMVVLGVLINILAAFGHIRLLGRLGRGEPYQPSVVSLGIVVTMLLAALGIAMTAYLVYGSS